MIAWWVTPLILTVLAVVGVIYLWRQRDVEPYADMIAAVAGAMAAVVCVVIWVVFYVMGLIWGLA